MTAAGADRPGETASSARMYDYLLGGKDNYAVDRAAAEATLAVFPDVRTAATVNRAFLRRSQRMLAEQGIRQFLDIGTGIPTEPNLHRTVQEVDPTCRIVYVDNDPVVLAHAAALMQGDPRGRTAIVAADAADPEAVLASPVLADVLDLREPVSLSLLAILHFLADDAVAAHTVTTLLDALPSGSHLTITHSTLDFDPETIGRAQRTYAKAGVPNRMRSRDDVERLFLTGLDVLEPGIVPTHRWRPDLESTETDAAVSMYAAVARKP